MSSPDPGAARQPGHGPRPIPRQRGFRAGIDVRVSIRPDAGWGGAAYAGAWWPRSGELTVELPELIAELDRRGMRIERFTYSLAGWPPLPRRFAVQGRLLRTGWFRSMDPQVVCLAWAGNRRADLLVVPPETDVLTAARALRLCVTSPDLPLSPQGVLALARVAPDPQVARGPARAAAP